MDILSDTPQKKICFVVMGFGKKTDHKTGRLLNLDATYHEIIKPAVEELGIKCIRADEINHSGVIDKEMYGLLLSADVVIADISTSNSNAIYELGVRHALKKNTTIIMSEKSGILHFDLNHIATIQYEHLGEDIGCSEARKVKLRLVELLKTTLTSNEVDSPVYTYIPNLRVPQLTSEEVVRLVEYSIEAEKDWRRIFGSAEAALTNGEFNEAKNLYQAALSLRPKDEYLIQRLTLCTYKAEMPSVTMACMNAMIILSDLNPDESNDPETTGLAGAIHKNIWRETNKVEFLDGAIAFYNRGFTIKKDYYNGENLAICYLEKASFLKLKDLSDKDYYVYEYSAKKTFEAVFEIVRRIIESENFIERNDKKWVYASAAKSSEFLGYTEQHILYTEKFKSLSDNAWDLETFNKNAIVSKVIE
ncbi:hypothetical protein QN386_10180 [Pseudomonas sp. CCI3.2]|uniref:tetratricopeptide repeat-containing protein n=1 Tax=unclassified Pseudomonas TaxID=196821 RepID=UPI002AC8DFCC|nr:MULTISPECIES: tetratricopeptide repeat-containing protein [unclassified Pseudomonas]MEB0077973.1 hypothetical protein [Pseudomonas sp. MH10out]MEB0093469.1 hypothetical protein [Pseudomonas sp. CCI4.2]MEB0101687.1 hypothetical protein [Pseudomonas sp. CCI3.2]MEB0129439.1 hypothetical protein [Pseudomonas sp. CCI2.4]MEB0159192.1 hypothetical protein [Pseudomonas sp. AH2 (2023)]